MYNVMFYITNKTQELFFYNRTNHSRVHQVYIGLTNSWANFADKLNNCTLQQNPRLQQNWTTLRVKSNKISGGLPWLLSALTPEYDIEVPTTPAWNYYCPIRSWSEYDANKVFCFVSFSWKFIQLGPGQPLAGGPRMDRGAVTSLGVVKSHASLRAAANSLPNRCDGKPLPTAC